MNVGKQYHTLCVWEEDNAGWFDQFGSYSLRKVKAERQDFNSAGIPGRFLAIISHDDTAQAMIAARDSLPAPKARA